MNNPKLTNWLLTALVIINFFLLIGWMCGHHGMRRFRHKRYGEFSYRGKHGRYNCCMNCDAYLGGHGYRHGGYFNRRIGVQCRNR